MIQLCWVVIVGGNCIFFVCLNIVYVMVSNQEMFIFVLEGLVECYNLYGECFGEVVVGVVLKYLCDFNLICECVFGLCLVLEILVYDIQQVCGIGLEVVILVVNKIVFGQIDSGIVGGVDIIFDVLIGVNEGLCKIFFEVNCGKSNLDKFKSLLKICLCYVVLVILCNGELCIGLLMGEFCELMVQIWQIFCDEQDRLVFESYYKLVVVYEEGWQNDLMMLFCGLICDQNLCLDIDLEKIGIFKLVFECGLCGIFMVVNLMLLIDGVLVVLLVSEEWVKVCGLLILVYFKDGEVVVVNFVDCQEGLLMVLVYVVLWLLVCNGLSLQDFDYYEIYEVFVVQVFCILKVWEDFEYCKICFGFDQLLGFIDCSKFNVKGSLLVVGYLFVVMGGWIVVNLVKLFLLVEQGCGLIFICVVGGQGVIVIIEW